MGGAAWWAAAAAACLMGSGLGRYGAWLHGKGFEEECKLRQGEPLLLPAAGSVATVS